MGNNVKIFTQRMEALQASMSCSDVAFAEFLGISRQLLYLLRSEKQRPSKKMMRILNDAERRASAKSPPSAVSAPLRENGKADHAEYAEDAEEDEGVLAETVAGLAREISNHWKVTQKNFQSLEKWQGEVSNHWKKTEAKFQALEAGVASLERRLDELCKLVAKALKK